MTGLSIIVPTIPGRGSALSRLLHVLGGQEDGYAEVIVVDGPGHLGDKIVEGLDAARGRLSVVVDDDDLVPADYVTRVREASASFPEFIGYHIAHVIDGRFAGTYTHRLDGDHRWRDQVRGVGPKCPFLTTAARQVGFGNEWTADRAWAVAMGELLDPDHGAFIDRHLYTYDFRTSGSAFVDGSRPIDVGAWPHDRTRFRWMSEER